MRNRFNGSKGTEYVPKVHPHTDADEEFNNLMNEREQADKAFVGQAAVRFSAPGESSVIINATRAREAMDTLHEQAPVDLPDQQLSSAS